ncbi:MAG: ribonuclease III [Rhodocyclales bacterium]|nr:ribonuclease III [Rhodocyclales bacterium]
MKARRLEVALGHGFARPELLRQALTHRSFAATNNEQLEFLGDSVLDLAIAASLCLRFPELKEGELSRLRANLVRQESLAEIALSLELGSYLALGEGELKSGGARRPSILADALEAIIGAIYRDAGFDTARAVVERLYLPALDRIDPENAGKDPKTALQEILQGKHLPLPRYKLLATRGEAHAQEFEVECEVPEFAIRTKGIGASRRIAEQQAAERALAGIRK